MLVEQLYIPGPLRNFHYLVACRETGEALAIDPVDTGRVKAAAAARGWNIGAVVCTHEHWDHVGGRADFPGATVMAAAGAPLDGIDRRLGVGDVVEVGTSVSLSVLLAPGHTPAHLCLYGHGHLFAGDTVFVAGVGNCRSGDPSQLFETIRDLIGPLPDDTLLMPGHDYAVNDLRFSVDREPDNTAAVEALGRAAELNQQGGWLVTDLGRERAFNVFLRTGSGSVRRGLGLDAAASDREVFLALRERRDRW